MHEMHQGLEKVLKRIARLNKNKFKFAKERVEVLGFVIDSVGIRPAPSIVVAVTDTPAPKNKRE